MNVNAHRIADEWDRQPYALPCADLEPDPYAPGHPYACSRPYEHDGPHAATVPAEPDCPLAPGLAEDWSFDLQACGRAEDRYLADLYGEPRRYP
jgi:hypothetical protein